MYPWSDYVGESYYWFMRNLILHDEQCIRVEMTKATARDRVLTSWVALHQMAVKLNEHVPEFTLQVLPNRSSMSSAFHVRHVGPTSFTRGLTNLGCNLSIRTALRMCNMLFVTPPHSFNSPRRTEPAKFYSLFHFKGVCQYHACLGSQFLEVLSCQELILAIP
jgi:hypothetical protein